jgi:hypothetical protein
VEAAAARAAATATGLAALSAGKQLKQ